MGWILKTLNTSPLWIALAGAHYLPYVVAAFVVVAVGVARRQMNVRELCVLAIFAGAIALEMVQLCSEGFSFFGENTWGVPRYFGVFAPLAWIWAALGLSFLWDRWKGAARWCVRIAVVGALAWLFASQCVATLRTLYVGGARHDAVVAAQRIAPAIRADYRGPRRQAEQKRTLAEYFTTRRPVVFGDFAAAAWMVRGQSEGALQGKGLCPYKNDYLFVRVGTGYAGKTSVDPREYEYVKSVRGGLNAEWRLFRRKPLTEEQRKWYNNEPIDRKGEKRNETRGIEGKDGRRLRKRRP